MQDPGVSESPSDPSSLPDAGNDLAAAAPEQVLEPTEAGQGTGNGGLLSDDESVLSDVDEAQFEDFDPNAIAIEDRPVIAVDESNVGLIGVHKRKRAGGETSGGKRKKKEGRRDKPKKTRKRRGDDEDGEDVGVGSVRRATRKGTGKPEALEDDWENLTPKERQRRALDAKMDEALAGGKSRTRKQLGIDLEAQADAEIQDMRDRMIEAANADNKGRECNQPAVHKLKLLPEVLALLNRNNLQNNLVDPETNILRCVRFFLEPLSDASMPAFNIQRELLAVLKKLPINRDSLVASGIGKVVLFYTRSPKVETEIKRQAESLFKDWNRIVLKRTDDYRQKEVAEAFYDPMHLPDRTASKATASQQAAAERRARALALPTLMNRARQEGQLRTYTVVPKSNVVASAGPIKSVGQSYAARRLKLGRAGNRRA